MRWLVQSNFIANSQVVAITDVLKKHRLEYLTVGVLPFANELICDDPTKFVEALGKDVIPYGSTTFLRIGLARDWRGLSFNGNFDCRKWVEARSDMLNADGGIITVKEAGEWARTRDPQELFFIRPVGDFKLFAGFVGSAHEIARCMGSASHENFSFTENDLVTIALPKNIQAEWRYFVLDGQIVSGSLYRMNGQRHLKRETDPAVLAEAQAMANVWLPHRNCVMDLALCDGVMKVIEFNCINGSGFYDHDLETIILAMNHHCH